MFKNKKTLTVAGLFALTVLSTVFFILPMFRSQAGALGSLYFYLSRMKAGLDGSAGNTVEYVVTFTPQQAIATGGTVTIEFPDDDTNDDGKWCRTAGDLAVEGVAASAADQASTGWDIDAALPGTLSASCAKGTGPNSVDTITITGLTALTQSTTYGVKLSNGSTGVIGTGATAGDHQVTVTVESGAVSDTKIFGVYLIDNDQVVVSATVSASPNVTCTISSNTVNLGTLYPGGAYATNTHTIGTSTSDSAGGYYWTVYGKGDNTDAGLYKSTSTTKLLASPATETIDLTGIGAEGFGMTASDPDAGGAAAVATDFADTSAGVFGGLGTGPGEARLLLSQIGAQTASEDSTITYGARAGASAPAGTYQETVTFVCGGYY